MERRALIAVVISVLILVALPGAGRSSGFYPPSRPRRRERSSRPRRADGAGRLSNRRRAAAAATPAVAPELAAERRQRRRRRHRPLPRRLHHRRGAPEEPGAEALPHHGRARQPAAAAGAVSARRPSAARVDAARRRQVADRRCRRALSRPTSSAVELTADGARDAHVHRRARAARRSASASTLHGDNYLWKIDIEVANGPAGYTEMALGWDEGMNPAGPNAGEVVFDQVVVAAGRTSCSTSRSPSSTPGR